MAALDHFTPPTREWFRAAFGSPTAAQEGAWEAVAAEKNALVVAPTGSGKTLSAFLWSIDRFFAEAAAAAMPFHPAPEKAEETEASAKATAARNGTRVLYISPLKALGVDVERNLRSPLVGIGHTAQRLERPAAEISVGVRTGDSTPKERRDLVRNPPDMLITTPESLYLMLTSRARSTLTGVDTVILDEIHALAGTKRGAHLALSLERLDALITEAGGTRTQRIGLSATVEPQREVARFLGGGQPVEIVAPESEKSWDITVCVPVPDLSAPTAEAPEPGAGDVEPSGDSSSMQPSIWPHVQHRMVDLITSHRSTIAFVNSRRLAEKLTGHINELWSQRQPDGEDDETPEELARAHHGSVSKDQRAAIEEDLKSGRLRCVIATSSLELGIDMGAVDLVIQVEAPPAVSAGLQRLGRAGHQVGETSTGWFFPKHRGDLLSTAVVAQQMLASRIESLHIPQNPLDVLAQQTVAAAALDTLDVETWFEQVRRAAPFSALPRSAFEAVLDLLAGKYPSDRFAELRPRVVWDRDAGTVQGRPGAQRLAVTSGGTIPDRGLFGVYLVGAEDARTGGRRVGELDEEMVYESRVGDVFALGATSWRIEEITFDQVRVSPAFGQPAAMPFWRGEALGRPAELGRAIGEFSRNLLAATTSASHQHLKSLGLDQWARENLLRYLSEQKEALGAVPDDRTLVVERTRDELGDWRILLHSPFGLQVHAPWALAVGQRLHQLYGLDGAAFADDDGIVLRVPMMDDEPPGAELFRFDADELEELITAQVSSSPLFAGRFREASARALLLPRQSPGQRTPLWQQRQRASQLLEIAHQFPDFPIIMEAMREVLQDVYDLPALQRITQQLQQRRISMVEATTQTPSPFAQSLLFGYIAQYLYEADAPLAERRAAALSLDPKLLNELLGRVELSEFLDAAIIAESQAHAQRLTPSRRLRGTEGVADLLRLLGPLNAEELAQRLESTEIAEIGENAEPPHASISSARQFAEELVTAHRAFTLQRRGITHFAAVEDAARLRDGLGTPLPPGIAHTFLEPVADPLNDLIGRYARTHAPFTAAEASDALSLPHSVVVNVLKALTEQSRIVEGRFHPESTTEHPEYVDAEMLRRIRRRSLAALRAAVEPAAPSSYAELLTHWQQVSSSTRGQGAERLAEVLTQLAGFPAPASSWESFILPARVSDYSKGMLDALLASGEFCAVGCGSLSGHDGWVAFYPREDAQLLISPVHPEPSKQSQRESSDLGERILHVLQRGGAWFPDALQQEITSASAEEPGTEGEVTEEALDLTLRDLFWQGQVIPDSYAAVRLLLAGGRTAHRKVRTPLRSPRNSRRMALRQAAQRSVNHSSTPSTHQVRWALPPQAAADPTEVAHTRAEILLDRYPVLTRGAVVAEQTPGGFSGVYRLLSAAEEAGRIRRGYFIEKLGAAQFSASAAIDRLREVADRQEDNAQLRSDEQTHQKTHRHRNPSAPETLTLAAVDPANAYGAALDWPPLEEVSARPARRAGAVVVIEDGALVLFMERGGRSMLVYTEDADIQQRAAESLVDRLRAAKSGRLAVERINGAAALQHPFAQALRAAGFHSSPTGLRFLP